VPPGNEKTEEAGLRRFEFTQVQMGVPFRFVLYAQSERNATLAADAAFARVEQLNGVMSDYDEHSELSRLSATGGSGRAVPLSEDLWLVLSRSQDLARRSDGAFDVTVGPLVRLWRRARRTKKIPSNERLAEARQAVGYEYLELDREHRTATLLRPDMRLDLGGIAKGYAVDEALAVLRNKGVTRALVDGGGDIAVGDAPPNEAGWRIGIAPSEAKAPPSAFLTLKNQAVATSGDAWQHVVIDGKRYSHIVDPRTGLGLTDRSSVTVVGPNCITVDGLASAVSVMGAEAGIALVESTPDVAAFVVRNVNGEPETHASRRWKDLHVERKR